MRITPAGKAEVKSELAPFHPYAGEQAIVAAEEKTPKRSVMFVAEYLSISGDFKFGSAMLVQLRADILALSGRISREELQEAFSKPLSIAMQAQEELKQPLIAPVGPVSEEKSGREFWAPSRIEEREDKPSASLEIEVLKEASAEPALKIMVQAREIRIQNAAITLPKDQVGVSAEGPLTVKDSHLEAEQLLLGAQDVSIAGEVKLTGKSQLIIKAVKDVVIEKEAKLSLHSSVPALIQADRVKSSHAEITFDELYIKANSLIQLWDVKLKGQRLNLEMRYVLAGWTSFSVEKQISIIGAVSLIGLCRITTNSHRTQTLLNVFALSLDTPSTLEWSASSALSLFLGLTNTAISVAHLFVHDPVVQGALIAARFTLNAGSALFNVVRLAADIYEISEKKIDEIAAIRLANPVKTLLFSLVSLGYGSTSSIPEINHLVSGHAVASALPSWDDPLTVINRINDVVGQLAAGVLPGRNVSSLVDVSAGLSLGRVADSHSSLISVDGGASAAMLPSQMNLVHVGLPSSVALTPAYSTDTGLLAYEMGMSAPLPIGVHNSRYLDYHDASPFQIEQQHHNIQAYRYTAESKQYIKHGAIEAEIFAEKEDFSAKESSIAVHHLVMEAKTKIALEHSQLLVKSKVSNVGDLHVVRSQIQIAELNNSSGASFEGSGSQLVFDEVQNQGRMVLAGSKLEAKQVYNQAGGILLGVSSEVAVGALEGSAGSVTALVDSKLRVDQVQDSGMLTADDSVLEIGKAVIEVGAAVGCRDSDVSIKDLDSKIGDFSLDWNYSFSSQLDKPSQQLDKPSHGHQHPDHSRHSDHSRHAILLNAEVLKPESHALPSLPEKPIVAQDLVYHSDHSLKGHLSSDGRELIYEAQGNVNLHGNALISPFSLAVITPGDIEVAGDNSSSAPLRLDGNKVEFAKHADSQMAALDVHAKEKIQISEGKLAVGGDVTLSGGKLVVDGAAHIAVAGDLVGDFQDIEIKGKTVVEDIKEVHHHLFSKEEKHIRTVTFKNVTVESGGNVALRAHGEINLVGVDITAEKNLILDGQENLNVSSMRDVNVVEKSHTTIVSSDHKSERSEVESASHLVASKQVLLSSEKSLDVVADVIAGEEIMVHAPHIKGSVSVLTQTVKEVSSGLSVQLPSLHVPKFNQTPIGQLLHSAEPAVGAIEVMSAAASKLATGINSAAATLQALRKRDPSAVLAALTGINPTISVSLGRQSAEASMQSLGSGGFYAPNLSIIGEEAQFANSFRMQAQHTFIHVGKMTAIGADLRSVAQFHDARFSASWGLFSGAPTFSASYAEQGSSQNIGLSHEMILGDLTLDVDDMMLSGVQPSVSHITGRIGVLTASAPLEESAQWGKSVGLSSSGNIDWSEQHSHSKIATATTPFAADQVLGNIASDLSIDGLTLIGESADGLLANAMHKIPIYEVQQSDARSISVPLGEFFSPSSGSVFSLLHYQSDSAFYKALRDDKLQVLADVHHHTQITLPIYHPEAGRQFLQDGRWLSTQLYSMFPSRPHPMPPQYVRPQMDQSMPAPDFTAMYNSSFFDINSLEFNPLSNFAQPYNDLQSFPIALDSDIGAAEEEGDMHGDEEHEHEKVFLTNHTNFGPLVEVVEKDLVHIELWNDTFQNLFKSSGFQTYLSTAQRAIPESEALYKDFIRTVLDPLAGALYDRSSYFYPLYGQENSAQFLPAEFSEPSNIFQIAEQTAENIDGYAESYTKLMTPLRIFYISGLVLENSYQIAKGESIFSLLKEDAYSTVGGITIAALGERLLPVCKDATYTAINFLLPENQWLLKPMSYFWKLSLPISGMIAGSIAGEYLADHDKDDYMDVAISLTAARQYWQAGALRDVVGAEFMESVLYDYFGEVLPEQVIDTYFNYVHVLNKQSTPFGQALIRPISRDIFGLSQIADKFSVPEDLPEKFTQYISDQDLNEYAKYIEDSELRPIYNVSGEFYRDIIDKHSDFSVPYINKLKNIGKSLFVLSAAEAVYQLVTAKDKLREAEHLGIAWGAAEAGGYVGTLAGAALFGAFTSPLCIAGLGLAAGTASVVLAEKAWDQLLSESKASINSKQYDSKWSPSFIFESHEARLSLSADANSDIPIAPHKVNSFSIFSAKPATVSSPSASLSSHHAEGASLLKSDFSSYKKVCASLGVN